MKTEADKTASTKSDSAPVGWRFALAVTFLALSICSFVTGGAILASNLSASIKGPAALLIFPVPEVLDLTAVAIVGKAGFHYLTGKLCGLLGRFASSFAPPDQVSKTRYRIGLVMFAAPLIFGWVAPYWGHHLIAFENHSLWFHVVGDLTFVASLFVLGGDFWDKLWALFVYDVKVAPPVSS